MKLTVVLCNNSDCSPSNQTASPSSRVCSHGSYGLLPIRPKTRPCISCVDSEEMHQHHNAALFLLRLRVPFAPKTGSAIRASHSFYITWFYTLTHRDFSADESTCSNKKAIIVPLVTSSWVRNLWSLSDRENDKKNPVWQINKKYLAPTRWFLKSYLLKACSGDHIEPAGQRWGVIF